MKHIFTVLALCAFPLAFFAQKTAVDLYFSNWKNDKNFTRVEITGKMMELAGYIETETPQEKEIVETIKAINGITVLSKDECTDAKALFSQATLKLEGTFDELMTVQEGNSEVKILLSEKNGVVNELLVVVCEETEFALVDVYGEINLRTIGKFMHQMNLQGMDKVSEEMIDVASTFKVYPNPSHRGDRITLTYGEDASGAMAMVYDATGKEIWRKKLAGTSAELEMSNYASGTFLLVVERDGARLFTENIILN